MGVEPRSDELSSRLASQGAMLQELRATLPFVTPGAARADARRAVLDQNVLMRRTVGAREKVFRKLAERYFPNGKPRFAALLVNALQQRADEVELPALAYVGYLWNDGLAFDLGLGWLARRLETLPWRVETGDVESHLEALAHQNPEARRWADSTRESMAQHYLGLLRDCGFATGARVKQLRRPFVPPSAILMATRMLVSSGEATTKVPEHPLFAAMGLRIQDVLDALGELASAGVIGFDSQGGVVRLTLPEGSDRS